MKLSLSLVNRGLLRGNSARLHDHDGTAEMRRKRSFRGRRRPSEVDPQLTFGAHFWTRQLIGQLRLDAGEIFLINALVAFASRRHNATSQLAFAIEVVVQSFEPPSTWMVVPVTQRASSDARKATTDPISAGSAMRCNACIPRMKLRPASVLAKFDISVSVTPGATALTRMPRGPSAAAKGFTSASTAPFDAE